jgi:hypothetical protein
MAAKMIMPVLRFLAMMMMMSSSFLIMMSLAEITTSSCLFSLIMEQTQTPLQPREVRILSVYNA